MSKKILFFLILSCSPHINAMGFNRFLARNSTKHRAYLVETTLEPNEQKELVAAPGRDLTIVIGTPEKLISFNTTVEGQTKLLDITAESPGVFVATQHTTRLLFILKTFPQGLLINVRNPNDRWNREIQCNNNNMVTEIPADTEELALYHAQWNHRFSRLDRAVTPGTGTVHPIIVKLKRDATGLKISQSTSGMFQAKQFKHVEIEEESE